MKHTKTPLCKLHPDFHLPANVVVGEQFDGYAYAQKAKEAGVDCLVHYAKDHYGHAYYPTKVGTMHPGLGFDMLKEFVSGCKEAGLSVSFDYSVFLDTAAVSANPEWVLQETETISPSVFEQKYLPVCVNSGYLEEMLIPQTLELIENYDVDELFYDTMSDFTPCYCARCVEKFGSPIPKQGDPLWDKYVEWYVRQYDLFFDRIFEVVKNIRPEIDVVVNWRWSATLPAAPVTSVRRLVGDLFASPSVASYFCRYWAGTGLPFDYMCGRFLHGLGDWSNSTSETLTAVAAATCANGGGFYIIDRQLPDGTLEDRSYPILDDVFSFVQTRRHVLTDTTHIAETAVLHSLENIIGGSMEYFPNKQERDNRLRPLKAISQILLRGGKHYTAINTQRLHEVLDSYKLLIIPETDFLNQSALSAIEAFAERGGSVLIVQSDNNTPVHEGLLSLAGVKCCGQAKTRYSYISRTDRGVLNAVLVRGNFALVKPLSGTYVESALIEPWCEGDGNSFGHGFAPPSDVTEYAAITSRSVGKGVVCYIAGSVLTSYFTYNNPDISACINDLHEKLLPKPIAKIAENAHIELCVVRKGDDLIVHLINQSGKETIVAHYLPVTEFIPYLYNIRLYISRKGQMENITLEPEGSFVQSRTEGEYSVVTIPHMHIMATCLIKGYFNETHKERKQ